MLEFLGDMGGLIEIIFLFVSILMGFIIERNFIAAMISDTYKVQKYSRDQSEFYKSEKAQNYKKKHVITSESDSSEGSSDSSSSGQSRGNPENPDYDPHQPHDEMEVTGNTKRKTEIPLTLKNMKLL